MVEKRKVVLSERYDPADLREALRVLKEGGVILYPTDTVWGLGCDATCEEAVRRIYRIKQRADAKAMLCLLDGAGRLRTYVDVPSVAWDLLTATEGATPTTIIYPNARQVAPSLIAEDGSLGIRITEEAFSKALCAGIKHPLVSTSANLSGQKAPKTFHQIVPEIRQAVDYICRFRRNDLAPHKPSAIIKLNINNSFQIIR